VAYRYLTDKQKVLLSHSEAIALLKEQYAMGTVEVKVVQPRPYSPNP
jgi:hypothetical protein